VAWVLCQSPKSYHFLCPAELAVAQGSPWGLNWPPNCHLAWQLIGNSVPPPMAYLAILGLAMALAGKQGKAQDVEWAAKGFHQLCEDSKGRWPRRALANATDDSRPRSRSPPPAKIRADVQGPASFLATVAPARPLRGGTRTSDPLVDPDTIWIDPPTAREVQSLIGVLWALRQGSVVTQALPGAGLAAMPRVRGFHAPPGMAAPRAWPPHLTCRTPKWRTPTCRLKHPQDPRARRRPLLLPGLQGGGISTRL